MGCGPSHEDLPPVRVLLLGPGGCGKSTIVKQMKVNYKNGFDQSELEDIRKQIRTNIVQRLGIILDSCGDQIGDEMQVEADQIKRLAQTEFEWNNQAGIGIDIIGAVKKVLTLAPVQEAKEKMYYEAPWDFRFFEHIDRLFDENYVPTQEDALNCRKQTIGLHEYDFQVDSINLVMIDVGGQRKERATWAKAMENITAIIFVSSLTDYVQSLEEDSSKNRLDEALELFSRVFHSPRLKNIPIVLLLNKVDLFIEMIQIHPMSQRFPDFKSSDTVDNSLKYMISRFIAKAEEKPSDKQLHIHPVCATDSDNFMKVFKSIKATIVNSNLQAAGLA